MKYRRNPLVIGELLTSAPGIKEYTTLFKGLCNDFFLLVLLKKKNISFAAIYILLYICTAKFSISITTYENGRKTNSDYSS